MLASVLIFCRTFVALGMVELFCITVLRHFDERQNLFFVEKVCSMKKNMKRETIVGLACLAISLTSTRFDLFPMFISGALVGCAMLLIIIGFLPEKACVTLKQWKTDLFYHAGK